MIDALTWVGILFCLSQSAMFSGLNLALFSLSRLTLEVEAAGGNWAARKVLATRADANFLLTTILWGNVGINVLLTLLSDSVMAGVGAFLFSTFAITIFGEIAPQAYFSRHALRMASRFIPLLRVYQLLLYPVVKPSAMMLDAWLGKEAIQYYRERHLKEIIRRHMLAAESEVDRAEAIGALNFLTIDDLPIEQEGVLLDPDSIIRLPSRHGVPVFPPFAETTTDPFLRQVEASGKAWVVITDESDQPCLVMDADGFLRHALFHRARTDPHAYCHRPVIIRDRSEPLGDAIMKLRFDAELADDNIITYDTILVWAEQRRLITGTDLLGRLLRGIAQRPGTKGAETATVGPTGATAPGQAQS